MIAYFDAAYVVKCYVNEPDSAQVQELSEQVDALCTSSWSVIEVTSAIRRYVREKRLTRATAKALLNEFDKDVSDGVWELLPITPILLQQLDQFLRTLPVDVVLRAGDALHLMTARQAGLDAIWTSDRHLLRAAPHFGLRGRSV